MAAVYTADWNEYPGRWSPDGPVITHRGDSGNARKLRKISGYDVKEYPFGNEEPN